jgi:biotin synthase
MSFCDGYRNEIEINSAFYPQKTGKTMIKHDWTFKELQELHNLPLLELISKAHLTHTQFHSPAEVQICSLISIKTGGCPEDCKYCAQSSRYQTAVSPQAMMPYDEVLTEAKKAIAQGATRVCLGAAWRGVRDGKAFDDVLHMITGITKLGVEVCCTLGMLNDTQAKRLKDAGLYAYNHNLDSSESFYKTIITTRTYQDRLNTLESVEKANLSVCCGGIIGMGECTQDRLELILTLCRRNPHPDSVPINRLSQIPGTPLEDQPKVSVWDMIRMIAIARVVMPKAMVRLSAGRIEMSCEEQALCFLAGANSLFAGEKLLTVANTPVDTDEHMFQLLGIKKRAAYSK